MIILYQYVYDSPIFSKKLIGPILRLRQLIAGISDQMSRASPNTFYISDRKLLHHLPEVSLPVQYRLKVESM